MTETEVYNEKGEVVNLRAQWFKAVARLRTLLTVNPREVHLFTYETFENTQFTKQRWLSDRYVMVRCSGDPTIKDHEDGMYWLKASEGLVPNEKAFQSDTAALLGNFQAIPDGEWLTVTRTQWSVADSPHKLMVAWICDPNYFGVAPEVNARVPVVINEGVWNAFETAFPGCEFQYVPDGKHNVFRVVAESKVVAYVAGGTIPPERKGEALVLVGVVD